MPELDEIDVYDIKIGGVFRVKATSSTDAINKAKEWVEGHAGLLDYAWALQKVFVEPEEE